MNKVISVVIPSYGRTDTLKRAIGSCLKQTYTDIEVIVVDDNANNNAAQELEMIVSEFGDSRIRLVHNKENLGGALARNEGIKIAEGEYIAFLDDDDEFLPEKLEKQVATLESSADKNLALVYCWTKEINKNGALKREYKYNKVGHCVFDGMYDCISATSAWLCKKSFLLDVGMFTDMPCKQDSYVLLKLLLKGYTIDRVPEILLFYHSDGAMRISTQGHTKRIIGEEKLYRLCHENYSFLKQNEMMEVEYSFATRLAEHYFAVGEKKKGKASLKTVILKHPFSRKSLGCYKRCAKAVFLASQKEEVK